MSMTGETLLVTRHRALQVIALGSREKLNTSALQPGCWRNIQYQARLLLLWGHLEDVADQSSGKDVGGCHMQGTSASSLLV